MENTISKRSDTGCGCAGTPLERISYDKINSDRSLNEEAPQKVCKRLNGPDSNNSTYAVPGTAWADHLRGPDGNATVGGRRGLVRATNFRDWPKVENNTLVFRDQGHQDAYEKYLESAINIPSSEGPTNLSQDPNDILETIEKSIGFLSLRSVLEAEFQRQNVIGWDRLEDIPPRYSTFDMTTKSVLNPKNEVRINGELLNYKRASYSSQQRIDKYGAMTPSGDEIQAIRSFDHGNYGFGKRVKPLDPIDNVGTFWNTRAIDGVSSSWRIRSHKTTVRDYTPKLDSPKIAGKEPCDNRRGITLPGLAVQNNLTNSYEAHATFIIDWDDDTPEETLSVVTPSGSDFSHTYDNDGTYEIRIRYYNNANDLIFDGTMAPIHIPYSCFSEQSGWITDRWAYRWDGNRAIRCSNAKYYLRYAPNKTRTFATTEAFHWERGVGGWKFRVYRAMRLEAWYTIHLGKQDHGCQADGTDGALVMPWNTTTAHVQQTVSGDVGWRALDSHHVMQTDDGLGYVILDMRTYPCEATGDTPIKTDFH